MVCADIIFKNVQTCILYFLDQTLRLLLISCTWKYTATNEGGHLFCLHGLYSGTLFLSALNFLAAPLFVFFSTISTTLSLKVVSKERFLTTSVVLAIQMILINSWYENVCSDQVWLLIEGSHYFTHKMDVGGYFLRTGTNWGWHLIKEIWYTLFFLSVNRQYNCVCESCTIQNYMSCAMYIYMYEFFINSMNSIFKQKMWLSGPMQSKGILR